MHTKNAVMILARFCCENFILCTIISNIRIHSFVLGLENKYLLKFGSQRMKLHAESSEQCFALHAGSSSKKFCTSLRTFLNCQNESCFRDNATNLPFVNRQVLSKFGADF